MTIHDSDLMHTNRPPKGDRSEGSYIKISILIDFSRFWVDFIKNDMGIEPG